MNSQSAGAMATRLQEYSRTPQGIDAKECRPGGRRWQRINSVDDDAIDDIPSDRLEKAVKEEYQCIGNSLDCDDEERRSEVEYSA